MSNMKYDDTDYLINREESIEYKISDTNVGNIEEDIKRCEQLIKPEHANWIGISNQLAIAHLIERIRELEEENATLRKAKNIAKEVKIEDITHVMNKSYEEFMKQFVPKQKVKETLIEIQEEFNKLDKETDKQIKDKNKDYYKCKENIAIMQTLAYCRDKFEELLEEK